MTAASRNNHVPEHRGPGSTSQEALFKVSITLFNKLLQIISNATERRQGQVSTHVLEGPTSREQQGLQATLIPEIIKDTRAISTDTLTMAAPTRIISNVWEGVSTGQATLHMTTIEPFQVFLITATSTTVILVLLLHPYMAMTAEIGILKAPFHV
jgi:hypothetical protein